MKKSVFVFSMMCCLVIVLSTSYATVSTDPYLVWHGDKEDMHIWRIQIEIKVENASDAGTDDSVFVELNDYNVTVLDKPDINDFEPNSVRTYDLLLDSHRYGGGYGELKKLRDIRFLRLRSTGMDELRISHLILKVNNKIIYTRYQYLNPIKTNSSLYIPSIVLRADSSWRNYTVPPRPKVIDPSELYNRIVSVVATKYLHSVGFQGITTVQQTTYDWNGVIKLYPLGNDHLRVYFPWKQDVGGTITAGEWFEFRFSCNKMAQYPGIISVSKVPYTKPNNFDGHDVGAEIQRALGGVMGWGADIYESLYFRPGYEEVPYPCQRVDLELSGKLALEYDIILWADLTVNLLSYETVLSHNTKR